MGLSLQISRFQGSGKFPESIEGHRLVLIPAKVASASSVGLLREITKEMSYSIFLVIWSKYRDLVDFEACA
jgi:hypothetical protein